MKKSFITVWLIVLILGLLGLFLANGGNLGSEFFIGSITTCAVTAAVVLFITTISNISLFTFLLMISGATLIMIGSASSGNTAIVIRNGILVIIIVIAPVALMYALLYLNNRRIKNRSKTS